MVIIIHLLCACAELNLFDSNLIPLIATSWPINYPLLGYLPGCIANHVILKTQKQITQSIQQAVESNEFTT